MHDEQRRHAVCNNSATLAGVFGAMPKKKPNARTPLNIQQNGLNIASYIETASFFFQQQNPQQQMLPFFSCFIL